MAQISLFCLITTEPQPAACQIHSHRGRTHFGYIYLLIWWYVENHDDYRTQDITHYNEAIIKYWKPMELICTSMTDVPLSECTQNIHDICH